MNTNRIEANKFSNSDTQHLFEAHWTKERIAEEHAEHQSCGYCFHNWPVGEQGDWMLCLNPKSAHHHETVACNFSCWYQEHVVAPPPSCHAGTNPSR